MSTDPSDTDWERAILILLGLGYRIIDDAAGEEYVCQPEYGVTIARLLIEHPDWTGEMAYEEAVRQKAGAWDFRQLCKEEGVL